MEETKSLNILLKESWDFFAERWVLFFKVTVFIWSPVLFVISFFWAFLFGTYNMLKNNKELLFSPKVILSAGIILMFLACILVIAVTIHQIIKIRLIDSLFTKHGEKYYLNFSGLAKEAIPDFWPVAYTQSIVLADIFSGLLLLVFPGVLFFIWFSFVSFEVILKKKKGLEALTGSKNIIRHSMGKFIGNITAMFVLIVLINISISGLSQLIIIPFKSEAVIGFANLASTAVSNIFSIWSSVFSFMLYRELDKRYRDRNAQTSNNDSRIMPNGQMPTTN